MIVRRRAEGDPDGAGFGHRAVRDVVAERGVAGEAAFGVKVIVPATGSVDTVPKRGLSAPTIVSALPSASLMPARSSANVMVSGVSAFDVKRWVTAVGASLNGLTVTSTWAVAVLPWPSLTV